MTDFKLRECPFCGGDAEYIERGNEHIGLKETVVRCKSCNCKQEHKWFRYKFDFEFVRYKTIEAWNRRAGEEDKHEDDFCSYGERKEGADNEP